MRSLIPTSLALAAVLATASPLSAADAPQLLDDLRSEIDGRRADHP